MYTINVCSDTAFPHTAATWRKYHVT
jgi:hypothetical protein